VPKQVGKKNRRQPVAGLTAVATPALAGVPGAPLPVVEPDEGMSPAKRKRLLALFVMGKTRPQIAKALRVDRGAVQQEIKRAEGAGQLPAVRRRMAAVLEMTLEEAFASKAKRPEKLSGYEIGVLFDKWQVLEGQATQIIEVRSDKALVADKVRTLMALANGTLPLTTQTSTQQGSTYGSD